MKSHFLVSFNGYSNKNWKDSFELKLININSLDDFAL